MSNPNPERNERLNQILNQIRERADLPSRWTPTWADVNFLLSLLDSHGAECNAADWAIERVQSEYLRGKSEAATRMRDRCVQKVRELRDQLQEEAGWAWGTKVGTANRIITALQSLTLEQEEQEKRGG